MFSVIKCFEIKRYVREKTLTLTYQDLLDKSKIHKRTLAHLCKPQESTTTTETNIIAMVKK